uniref:Uncharacterized protein n=1 Tax=Chromera velia CCMP2878 TaxID=1169474 RepID=A0A0G4I7X9_9ALVE|eukprot:Cvel_11712.t1-p1 / transcript=Cvel_11712.t1 / gene=Cvel_11712 / organism=Chromera_velia_CCMP2878 / gene_product=hypothetical protein / transcript_product=hypothetical protein / location=Cvel_scaffold743:30111-31894(+) / protein_length=285 / sequence_SO=supercontig / SO=protein_coding / is_pseudo=false
MQARCLSVLLGVGALVGVLFLGLGCGLDDWQRYKTNIDIERAGLIFPMKVDLTDHVGLLFRTVTFNIKLEGALAELAGPDNKESELRLRGRMWCRSMGQVPGGSKTEHTGKAFFEDLAQGDVTAVLPYLPYPDPCDQALVGSLTALGVLSLATVVLFVAAIALFFAPNNKTTKTARICGIVAFLSAVTAIVVALATRSWSGNWESVFPYKPSTSDEFLSVSTSGTVSLGIASSVAILGALLCLSTAVFVGCVRRCPGYAGNREAPKTVPTPPQATLPSTPVPETV